MCELGDAISNDSGLVDVNRLFGLNLPSSSRVQFRKKTTCQILPTDGYHRFIGPNESYQLPDGTETVFLKPMLILQYGDATGSLGNMTHWLDMRKVNSSDTYNQA
jgi:hypothetical protein